MTSSPSTHQCPHCHVPTESLDAGSPFVSGVRWCRRCRTVYETIPGLVGYAINAIQTADLNSPPVDVVWMHAPFRRAIDPAADRGQDRTGQPERVAAGPPTSEPTGEPARAEQAEGSRPKRRRGRKTDTDPTADRRVADAWQTGSYKDYEECGQALGMSGREVKLAIDRDRKRHSLKRRRQQAPE
jgi:hypothetical protein